MNPEKEASELSRRNAGFLTEAVVSHLIAEAIGEAKVLCIVGRARSGKTWALRDWAATARKQDLEAAYIDCKGIAFDRPVDVHYSERIIQIGAGVYPMFTIAQADVVIIDEPEMNPQLVRSVYLHTSAHRSLFTHGLLVLAIHDLQTLKILPARKTDIRCYSVAGVPIAF